MEKTLELLAELPEYFEKSWGLLFPEHGIEKLLFFDIETTGLSAKTSSLYLIGACYYHPERRGWELLQFFAEEFDDERLLLEEFHQFAGRFSLLLHYNGRSFDLPYLNAKCEMLSLPFRFEQDNVDIYQLFHKDKVVFPLNFPVENKKQRTLEALAGFARTDRLEGKELIRTYTEYKKERIYKKKEQAEAYRSLLLLHNHDDLCGLLCLCPLAGSVLLAKGAVAISCTRHEIRKEQGDAYILSLTFSSEAVFLPASLPLGTISEHGLTLELPGKFMELKYFFPDYKNYYYLPEEDMAVHKSVAEFVDRSRREKASPETCYIKKQGIFFRQPSKKPPVSPVFYEEYHGENAYFEWNDSLTDDIKSLLKLLS